MIARARRLVVSKQPSLNRNGCIAIPVGIHCKIKFPMIKKYIPFIIVAVCSILILINFIFENDSMDQGFWLRNIANILLIFAMVMIIRDKKKKAKKLNNE